MSSFAAGAGGSFSDAIWDWLTNEQSADDISIIKVFFSLVILIAIACCDWKLKLGAAKDLIISGVRCMVQLLILGAILSPLFKTDKWELVFGYIYFFMLTLAGYETAARNPKAYPRMMLHAIIALGVGVSLMLVFVLIICTPKPHWYSAQYLIPMTGMLISNQLSGTSSALKLMLEYLVTNKEHMEILLSFGATPTEAAWPGFVNCYRTALISNINSMNVIGLVAIPGMMTGQILGGAAPGQAARYQIVIMFLISGGTVISVFLICLFCVMALFDERGRLDTNRVYDNKSLKVGQIFSLAAWRKRRENAQKERLRALQVSEKTPLELKKKSVDASTAGQSQAMLAAVRKRTEEMLQSVKIAEGEKDISKQVDATDAVKEEAKELMQQLAKTFEAVKEAKALQSDSVQAARSKTFTQAPEVLGMDLEGRIGTENRVLRATMTIKAGEVACIMGPSGIGKSTLLKIVNDMLQPATPDSKLKLEGQESHTMCAQKWRSEVLYVHQSSGSMPGCPKDLIQTIEKLKIRKGMPSLDPTRFFVQWGLPEDALTRPWNKLSGGERQRAMVAIALTTSPKVLLLDEPTSALDDATKEKVEANIRELTCPVLFVTHDKSQAERISTSVWEMVEKRDDGELGTFIEPADGGPSAPRSGQVAPSGAGLGTV